MGLLNRASDGQLTALLALSRTLAAYGPLPEDRLRALCAPRALVGDGNTSTLHVHKTLLRFKQLGLFVESPRGLRLAPPFDSLDLTDVELIRSPLRALVLRMENNPLEGRDMDADSGDASDLSLGVAWVLQQDPYAFSAKWADVERLQNEQATKKFFANGTRWDGLCEWATFLGLCRFDGLVGPIPNPVHAVRAALPAVLGAASSVPIVQFLGALAVAVPVLDRGAYWQAAAGRVASPALSLGPSDLSISLSLALRQLDHERRIRLDRMSDAREVFRLLGRGGRELMQVTHISAVMEPGS